MDQGSMVRAARGRLRMTQAALASAAGVSINTVKRAESGLPVQDETIRGICAVLDMDVASFPRIEPVGARPPATEGRDNPDMAVSADAERRPMPWFGGWAPRDNLVRPTFFAGLAILIGIVPVASAASRLLSLQPAVAPPPAMFSWLDPADVNFRFLSLTLFTLMIFSGYGIVRGLIESQDADIAHDMDTEADQARVALACCSIFWLFTPLFDHWSVIQYIAMMAVVPPGGAKISWLAGWPLIAVQVYLFCVLAKLCGSFLRAPPVWPFAMMVALGTFAHTSGGTPVELVTGALVVGCTVYVAAKCKPRATVPKIDLPRSC